MKVYLSKSNQVSQAAIDRFAEVLITEDKELTTWDKPPTQNGKYSNKNLLDAEVLCVVIPQSSIVDGYALLGRGVAGEIQDWIDNKETNYVIYTLDQKIKIFIPVGELIDLKIDWQTQWAKIRIHELT